MNISYVPLKRLVDPSRAITYGIVQAGPDTPDGVPYIRPVDMTVGSGVEDPEKLQRTTREIAAAYRRSTVRAGDIVVSIGPSFGKIMVVPEDLAGANLTQGTARVAPAPGVNGRYLYWALQSSMARQYWESSVGGATFRALNLEPLSRTPIPEPPLEEQRRIADFLDAETARIDNLNALRSRQLSLLVERRGSILEKFLPGAGATGGTRFGTLFIETDVRVGSAQDRPLLSVSIHSGVRRFSDLNDRPPRADSFANYKSCEKGDIVLNRMRAFQGAVGVSGESGMVSPDYAVLRPLPGVLPRYLHYLFRSPYIVSEMTTLLRGIGSDSLGNVRTPRVNVGDLKNVKVPARDNEEQARIVSELDSAEEQLGSLHSTVQCQLDLLAERRQALITAAVTGEFDVSAASGRGIEE